MTRLPWVVVRRSFKYRHWLQLWRQQTRANRSPQAYFACREAWTTHFPLQPSLLAAINWWSAPLAAFAVSGPRSLNSRFRPHRDHWAGWRSVLWPTGPAGNADVQELIAQHAASHFERVTAAPVPLLTQPTLSRHSRLPEAVRRPSLRATRFASRKLTLVATGTRPRAAGRQRQLSGQANACGNCVTQCKDADASGKGLADA